MGCFFSRSGQRLGTSARSHAESRMRPSIDGPPDLGSSRYKPLKHLGHGAAGDVWAFRDTETGEVVAIKFIKRPLHRKLAEATRREFTIQAELGYGHVNLIKAYEAILTPTHLCLVMEYAAGGDLTSHVLANRDRAEATGLFLLEDEARYIFRQFLSAVKYCHSHQVAHRDLKLDNTLLSDDDPPIIKLCDFGVARGWEVEHGEWATSAQMSSLVGTLVYMPPELVGKPSRQQRSATTTSIKSAGCGKYDAMSVDVWSSGVLLVVMLLGTFPFDHQKCGDFNPGDAKQQILQQQMAKRWSDAPHMVDAVKQLSIECRNLLDRIFVLDSAKRISMSEIAEHPWCKQQLPSRYQRALDRLEQQQQEAERRFSRLQSATSFQGKNLALLVNEARSLPVGKQPAPQCVNLRMKTPASSPTTSR